ncbi:TPA: helix-turn-helix domain-containing protein [Legionella bozemanae]
MSNLINYPVAQLGNPKSKKLLTSYSQQARLLKFLERNGKISTMKAREILGILHPCGRSKELRAQGHQIETHWTKEADANGVFHRIGLYVYKGQNYEVGHDGSN